ncbi:MAG: sigma-54-dependent Fis family transcriptional regulator [Deltaproteobacteria bacterium]|nr:sigma-54-dependent Fis family transcriptional regulator [Deltaproteobacteria bacterium]
MTEMAGTNMNNKATILVVDDEHGVRQSFNIVLKDEYYVLLAGTGAEAIDIFTKNNIDLILLDILLPDINGVDLLEKLKEIDPNTEIIMVTAVKEIPTAVKAIKLGAYEYVSKPFLVDEVLTLINRALEKRSLVREVSYLRSELERYHPFEKMVGNDKAIRAIFELISTISKSDGPVLIQGESGTGKELVARALHNLNSKEKRPFVVINCAAIPSTLMESEIFGHIRGAYTGATSTTLGKLELAHRGTVFLDDIDTLDINMQGKLLRVIQEKEFERLGSTKVIRFDSRFVAASNRDLRELIYQGIFREDLFYRLNVFPVKIPSLRERKGDIPLLLDHFLELHYRKTGKPAKRFSKEAINFLKKYDWPGNVRELENLVERLSTIVKKPVIHIQDVTQFSMGLRQSKGMKLKDAVNVFEKKYIAEALESAEGSRQKAAEVLGIHRNTLLAKMNESGQKKN